MTADCQRCHGPNHRGGRTRICQTCIDTGKREDGWKRRGLTAEQYAIVLEAQGGVCAGCSNPPRKVALSVDHDHQTGVFRGLLCYMCNRLAMRGIRENPAIAFNLYWYLTQPPAVTALGEIQIRDRSKRKAPR